MIWHTIKISPLTNQRLQELANDMSMGVEFKLQARWHAKSESFVIDIDDDVLRFLKHHQREGESLDDVIRRRLTTPTEEGNDPTDEEVDS